MEGNTLTPADTNTETITPNEEAQSHEHTHEPQKAPPRSECERELHIEIPQDVVSREFDTALSRYGKQARLPGFRKGKVPPSMLKRQFGDQIKQEVLDRLIPQYIQEESQKQNLRPISQPRLTDLHAHDNQPWHFTAVFETFPEVNVGDYKNSGIHMEPVQITDEDLDQQITALREQHATYDPVEEDRELRDGDFAAVSFEGTPKLKEGEEGSTTPNPAKMDDVLVEIGGNNTVPEFSDNLRGARVGDERTFEVAYPQDFSEPRLAGQTINYKVKVNGLKKKSLPELNDDFAKELGQFDNYEDFRNKFRENMQHERSQEAERQTKDKLVQYLVDQSHFPVPEVFVNQQVDIRLN
ncbi:MAG TPA: trigger factor, partial [Terriglobales bacterium]